LTDQIALALSVAYGRNSRALADKRIAGLQTLSGLGAGHVGVEFLKRFWNQPNLTVYTTTPTWPIHNTLLEYCGVKDVPVPYYNPKTRGLDFEGFTQTLNSIPDGSVVLLHVCAHNPTGVDPTPDQWRQIADIFVRKRHYAFFDMAYQGFATGDLERDNFSVRLWEEKGLDFCLAQSFAKSMGLYGERLGTFSVVCENSREAGLVDGQLSNLIARHTWSSPPRHGSEIAKVLLKDPKLYQQWLDDMQLMAGRIRSMREKLGQHLKEVGSPHKWSHITDQIGMFAFTGLTEKMCYELIEKHHIYLLPTGRISISGLNSRNVQYVAQSFDAVTRNAKF